MRELLRGELAARGYHVLTAQSREELTAVLDRHEIDVVLSDAMLAGAARVSVAQRSRQLSPASEIVLATRATQDVAGIEAGAFDYVRKPYAIAEVVATLERALERRQLRAESALYRMSRVILDTREPHQLPDVIVRVALEAMGADDVALMLPGHDDKLYVACSTALTDSIGREVHDALAQSVIARAPMLREPLIDSDQNVHSYILYPLCMSERLIGLLVISRLVNPRPFRKLDLDKASVVASHTLLALENMRLLRHAIAAERFATVGQVATSIAHEVNNPMAYVIASQTHLRDQLVHVVELCKLIDSNTDPAVLRTAFARIGGPAFVEELVQASEDVREGAARVRDILRDTRALANNQTLEPTVFDVNEAIRSALRIVAAELRHKTEVTTQLADGLRVIGVPGQLSQVFVNLFIHAAEGYADRSGNLLAITSKRVGGHIVITLTDNGPGIAPEQLPRIFDTFNSTNSGLGLPISRDIVRHHGGEISAESARGVGTTFTIVLPQTAQRLREQTAPPPVAYRGDNPRMRLLFIDDEANILRSYKRAFGRDHEVTTVTSGNEALSVIGQSSELDLIVCDLSMPLMSGMQLYQIVRERHPPLAERFVFATGGATQRELEEFLRSVTNRVLEKPFDMAVLRELIADLQRVA